MPKWDKGAAFDELKEKILALLREERQKAKRGSVIARKRLAHTIILLIQLRNGSRVGEAIEAFFKFKESKEREVRVRLEKQRGYEERIMILPLEVTEQDLDMASSEVTKYSVKHFARRSLGVNTHSLRYAFVTHYAQQYSPQIVAKFTGHKKLEYLLTYTQKRKAEEILRNLPF